MGFKIPKSRAADPNEGRGGGGVFPEGDWIGKIEEVRVKTISKGDEHDFLIKDKNGYFAETAEIASIQLGSAVAKLEGQEDPGEQKMFDDGFYLSMDGTSWDADVDISNFDWRFEATRNRLTNLAFALGAVEEDGDDVGPVPHFDHLLRTTSEETGDGLYGSSVGFTVYHRKYKKRTDGPGEKSGVDVKVGKYEGVG